MRSVKLILLPTTLHLRILDVHVNSRMSNSTIEDASIATETKSESLTEKYASAVRVLDARRRAALKEIDEAKFSYVLVLDILWRRREVDLASSCRIAGGTRKSVSSLG